MDKRYSFKGKLENTNFERIDVGTGDGLGRKISNNTKQLMIIMLRELEFNRVVNIGILINKEQKNKLLIIDDESILEFNNFKPGFRSIDNTIQLVFYNTKESTVQIYSYNNLNLNLNIELEFKVEVNVKEKFEALSSPLEVSNNKLIEDKVTGKKLNFVKEIKEDINTILQKIDSHLKDLSIHLQKDVDRIICSLNSINSIYSFSNKDMVDFVGIISNLKNEDKLTVMELSSTKDSNIIKFYLYNKKVIQELSLGLVIAIKKVQIKVNKNLDFVVEGLQEQNIEILGKINDLVNIKKFRFDQSAKFDTLISLCNPILCRNIKKVKL